MFGEGRRNKKNTESEKSEGKSEWVKEREVENTRFWDTVCVCVRVCVYVCVCVCNNDQIVNG